jgi:broad specificity phosphatase PhoE
MRYVGSSDEPLTELGEQQAVALGEAVGSIALDGVYSSPLLRARQTAAYLAEPGGHEVRIDPRLREQAFGEWEGLSHDEIMERDPEILESFSRRDDVEPPGGEAQVAVLSRVVGLIEELAADGSGEERRSVALVSHVGPIKSILAASLDIPLMNARRIFLDPATVSVVDWGETPIVRLCNLSFHGGWRNARWMESAKVRIRK